MDRLRSGLGGRQGCVRREAPAADSRVGRSNTLSVIYDMHDRGVERGESSSQRQAQGRVSSYRSFSSLCWLPTTTPSSSRCAKRGACRSALPRPPIRISSVFVPQILRDAPLGSRAKRRTAASSARKSCRKIGCGGQLDLRIQNTRPLLQSSPYNAEKNLVFGNAFGDYPTLDMRWLIAAPSRGRYG